MPIDINTKKRHTHQSVTDMIWLEIPFTITIKVFNNYDCAKQKVFI